MGGGKDKHGFGGICIEYVSLNKKINVVLTYMGMDLHGNIASRGCCSCSCVMVLTSSHTVLIISDMGVTMALVTESLNMASLSMGNLASAGSMAGLESISSRDGSDMG
ncbi:hypothetical protein CFP56_035238 [Quercus suber]|uniref:Uncharacterized protein n=1 Tax=Quercus suber TaxID=58331 RepID=A0AAW0LR36_QUESU